MKIKRLELKNFRAAEALQLDFRKNLNVFVGVNGAGKSTVLDAIAIMLSWSISRIRHSGAPGKPIPEESITNRTPGSVLKLTAETDDRSIEWKLVKVRKGHSFGDERSDLSELSQYTKQVQEEITLKRGKVNLPLFVYYPVNRVVIDIPLRIRRKHSFGLLEAYDDALTGGANFRLFFEWFRAREDLENENLKYVNQYIKPDGFQYPDSQLQSVRKAIEQFMPLFRNLRVRRNPLKMTVEKNDINLSVNQLSDGEKCLLGMVGDLARRFAIANPDRENPLDGEGIVLIDEVDLHLHPKWQRMIVGRLRATFPNCQFILSTHSPHILTHVLPESIYMLEQTTLGIFSSHPSESYGMSTERIVRLIMDEDSRPQEVLDDLDQLFEFIERKKIDEAKELISSMKKYMRRDPEIMRAEMLIRQEEILT